MTPSEWNAARDRLEAAGVETAHVDGSSHTSPAQMASVLN